MLEIQLDTVKLIEIKQLQDQNYTKRTQHM